MARYKVVLAYDGTKFYGSQRQSEGRTVQAEFEKAIKQLGWQDRSVMLAGRTDAGVHASGQVVSFDLDWVHELVDLQRALNSLLPKDIAVRSITQVSADFHPRFDAISRCYHYHIHCDSVRDPLKLRYTWQVWPPMELERLNAAAKILIGNHDFSAFGRAHRKNGSTIRSVIKAEWLQQGQFYTFSITANAFLYHMVRRLVHVLVSVGQGNLNFATISDSLETPSVSVHQGLAPPEGLELVEVCYPS
jgi:tRNA pseudouridine38-40 synthase